MQGFGGHSSSGHGGSSQGHKASSSGSGGLLGSLTSQLPGGLGSAFNSLNIGGSGRTREAGDYDAPYGAHASSSAPYQAPPSPQPSQWGNFQPYQSSYAGEGYQPPAEYTHAAPSGGYGWAAQGQYSDGHGAEPSYTVPTAYQQGYENYGGAGPGGYEQPPAHQHQHQEPPAGGYSSYGQNASSGSGGRQWGGGGANSAW
jgi:hypothetical protein